MAVEYTVTISGSGEAFTITRGAAYNSVLFRIQNGGALTLQSIILDGDKDNHPIENNTNRSLIYVAGGSLHLATGAILRNNNAYQEGGGLYLSGNAAYTNTLLMDGDARISRCWSRTSGGGLMAAIRNSADSVTISEQAAIEYNEAANGGGIYFRSYVENAGGALTVAGNIKISNNNARSTGGGIYCSGYWEGNGPPAFLTVSGNASVFSNSATHGGGIYFYGVNAGDRFVLADNAQITGNSASGNGGGICLSLPGSKADVSISSAISENSGGTGGGLYLLTAMGGSASFTGAITGNRAVNGASGSGGAVWINNTSATESLEVSFLNAAIEQNSATAWGGGIYLIPGIFSLDVTDSVIESNTAGTNGGGLVIGTSGGGNVQVTGGLMKGNSTEGSGGGYYFSNNTPVSSFIHMSNVEIVGNTAKTEGGGLRFTSGNGVLVTTLRDCIISDNIAQDKSGGGIWNAGTDNRVSIAGNTVITRNISESGNGGGIYFTSEHGSLTLSDDVQVTDNHAGTREAATGSHGGGIYAVRGHIFLDERAEIAWNSALRYGGGVSVAENSRLDMSGGSIHDNRSYMFGGGLYSTASALQMTGGDIFGNLAAIGGAIYNATTSTATITYEALIGGQGHNFATSYAPGIYNAGTFFADGNRKIANGVYIEERGAVVRLQGALTSSSILALNNSRYVTSNPAGTPIVVGESTVQYPLLSQMDAEAFRKPSEGFDGWEIHLSDDHTQVLLEPALYFIEYKNLMGAQNTNPERYTVVTPTFQLVEPSAPPRFRFLGWYDAPLGGNRIEGVSQGTTGNRTLYAQWESLVHVIIYHGNDATGSPAYNIPAPLQVWDGESAVLAENNPTRIGYLFTGWNTDPTGIGSAYQPGEIIENVTGDWDLYAQWIEAPTPPAPPTPCCRCCRPCCCKCN